MIYQYQCNLTTQCEPIEISLIPGRYLLECYGAQGGTGLTNSDKRNHGGYGAYASGILNLKTETTFYLYIGGKGEDGINSFNQVSKGGWNGGGDSGKDTGDIIGDTLPDTPGASGGSTDIRMIRTAEREESTDLTSLDSRIIVAAGGSGSCYNSFGAPGGDLTGYIVTAFNNESYSESDTNQTSGYSKGRGENGRDFANTPSSGSGGGYYGGIASDGTETNEYKAVSSSGSSYVAGHRDCPKFENELGSVFDYKLTNINISNGFNLFPSLNYGRTK